MTPTLLSPEALDAILKNIGDEYPSIEGKLRAHIAALEAALAEVNAVANVQTDKALRAEADKETLLRSVERLTVEWVHPDEHAKALVRARNEGIAHVAAAYDADAAKARDKAKRYAGQPIAREWANAANRCEADAARIRAMKETEE